MNKLKIKHARLIDGYKLGLILNENKLKERNK